MEIKGIVKKIQAKESRTSKAGKTWESQVCIIETESKYNNQVALKFMGDKISLLDNLKEGDNVIADCNVYSREYKGRYYNNIDCWRIGLNSGINTDDFVEVGNEPF